MVWARAVGHTVNYDKYATLTYQVTPLPLTAVTLSAHPAVAATGQYADHADRYSHRRRRRCNTSSASATPTPRAGTGRISTASYTTTATCTWTPTRRATTRWSVWARLIGHTANYDRYAALTYQVNPPATDRGDAQRDSRRPAAGQYAHHPDRHARPAAATRCNTSSAPATPMPPAGIGRISPPTTPPPPPAPGRPAAAGTYTLVVWARAVGHTANYDKYAAITYQVTVPPLTAVTLNATPRFTAAGQYRRSP